MPLKEIKPLTNRTMREIKPLTDAQWKDITDTMKEEKSAEEKETIDKCQKIAKIIMESLNIAIRKHIEEAKNLS